MAPSFVFELRTGCRCVAEKTSPGVRPGALAGPRHRQPRRLDQAPFPANGHGASLGPAAAVAGRTALFQRAHLRAPPGRAGSVLLLELAVAALEPAAAGPAAWFDLCVCRFHVSTPPRIRRIARSRVSEGGLRAVRLRSPVGSGEGLPSLSSGFIGRIRVGAVHGLLLASRSRA